MAQAASRSNSDDTRALVVQPPRLPMPAQAAPAGVSPGQWKVLVESIFPSAQTVDGVMLAVDYCKSRGLDIMKKVVHVVPMWNSALNREVETVWPGIAEVRITAQRTGQWAGTDACEFGPLIKKSFHEKRQRGGRNGGKVYIAEAATPEITFPEWAQITVWKIVAGQRVAFVGPKVYFEETFSGQKGLRVPNDRWQLAPRQMLEKCAEAAALRRAFPEELGNVMVAEEMEGKVIAGDPLQARKEAIAEEQPQEQRPTRESTAQQWAEDEQRYLDWLQPNIDACTDPEKLRNAKEDEVAKLVADGWSDRLMDEVETRFDTAILKLEGDDQPQEGQGE